MARDQRNDGTARDGDGRGRDGDVVRITRARQSLSEDLKRRQRRYIVSMLVRTVVFIASVALLRGWARWVGMAVAIVLPWFAVVVANVTRTGSAEPPVDQPPPPQRPQLGVGEVRRGPVTVRGTATERRDDAAGDPSADHTVTPPTASGPDGPVELTTSRRN